MELLWKEVLYGNVQWQKHHIYLLYNTEADMFFKKEI